MISSDNIFFGFDCSSRVLGRSKRLLSFSGGVDSLAAHYLCGPDAQLLSLEFGGHFKRESDFFKRWDTKIIRTDFRNKPFDEKLDWRFIAAGAILMSDFIGVESLLFGTILEASPFWFNVKTKTPYENARMYQVFELADIKIGQTVISLSEYGTTKVASSFGREILSSSIESAAAKGSLKLFRKLLLEKIVLGDEITNDWTSLNKPKNKSIFGKSFTEDILSLYFSWKLGATFVSEYLLDMSDDFKSAADTLDMGFFEKYNPENLVANPPDLRDRFVTIFRSLDLLPYSESDYENINAVREFLSGYFRL